MSQEDKPCNPHPDAPHGFDRNASHNAGRYVCECEGWEPVAAHEPETESFVQTVPDHCDRIVWKGTYIHLPIANAAPCARCKELEAQVKDWKRGANAEAREVDAAHAKITEQAARIKSLEAEAADRESFLKTLADTCTEAERIAIERAGRIDALEAERRNLRARLEKAEPIVAAARNLIEQKGRHNTEIAYKRLADAIAKESTA